MHRGRKRGEEARREGGRKEEKKDKGKGKKMKEYLDFLSEKKKTAWAWRKKCQRKREAGDERGGERRTAKIAVYRLEVPFCWRCLRIKTPLYLQGETEIKMPTVQTTSWSESGSEKTEGNRQAGEIGMDVGRRLQVERGDARERWNSERCKYEYARGWKEKLSKRWWRKRMCDLPVEM